MLYWEEPRQGVPNGLPTRLAWEQHRDRSIGITLALTAELTAVLKKQFLQTGQPVFDATNLRREWASATVAAKCPELLIHDLRRSGARNLVNAGVPETVAMKIGGWKTPSVFIRYAIVATKDIQNAMNASKRTMELRWNLTPG